MRRFVIGFALGLLFGASSMAGAYYGARVIGSGYLSPLWEAVVNLDTPDGDDFEFTCNDVYVWSGVHELEISGCEVD